MPRLADPSDIANSDAAMAAECYRMACAYLDIGAYRDAAASQQEAAEWAASAMFNRLLIVLDDVDEAEAAFDAAS